MSVKNNIDDDYTPTNREKSHTASRVEFWCSYCDTALVAEGARCPVCRKVNHEGKRKVV